MDLMNGGGTESPTWPQIFPGSTGKRNALGKPQIAATSAGLNIRLFPPTTMRQSGLSFLIVQHGRENSWRNQRVFPFR